MKYRITENSKLFYGTTLYQIQGVDNGELGGWIEKESNLDQEGSCWVYGNALVLGDARVLGDAQVYGDARVLGNARVFGDAQVFGDARVSGNAEVFGDAQVYGDARVYGDAQVFGNAWVLGNALVYGDAQVYGNARVYGDAVLSSSKNFAVVIMGGGDGYTITLTDNHVQIGCEQVEIKKGIYQDLLYLGLKVGMRPEAQSIYIDLIMTLLRRRGLK